ncbi:hypothetical protein [Methyloceanibacter sp.]|uniref:hypothetical protein n=1 Tax=Methyloceanibacter sp. TaxID=1965321 RepID=UPI003D6D03E4
MTTAIGSLVRFNGKRFVVWAHELGHDGVTRLRICRQDGVPGALDSALVSDGDVEVLFPPLSYPVGTIVELQSGERGQVVADDGSDSVDVEVIHHHFVEGSGGVVTAGVTRASRAGLRLRNT